jgi:hypothetical protein
MPVWMCAGCTEQRFSHFDSRSGVEHVLDVGVALLAPC